MLPWQKKRRKGTVKKLKKTKKDMVEKHLKTDRNNGERMALTRMNV